LVFISLVNQEFRQVVNWNLVFLISFLAFLS